MTSPIEYEPCFWFSVLMIVADDCSSSNDTLVATSWSGSDVVITDDGSIADTVSTGGVQSEQNMSRCANGVPSLLRVALTWVIGFGATTGSFGAVGESFRYLASTMWLVAFAAKIAHTNTTTAPRTQQ